MSSSASPTRGPLIVGIVRGHDLLANEVASSVEEHVRFGGVVPEVASRAHLEAMVPTLQRACATADIDLSQIDANGNVAGDGAFVIVAAFTNTRGELVRSFDSGSGKTSFLMDINGDGQADTTITTDADNSGYSNFVL